MRLSPETWHARARFLDGVRNFLGKRGYLELETPLLNPVPTAEAHLNSLSVRRGASRRSVEAPELPRSAGYLITSPEYRLKSALAVLRCPLFQIAHAFRDSDRGQWHSEEFLMLELYLVGADEHRLMQELEQLIQSLTPPGAAGTAGPIARHTVLDLLREHAGARSWQRGSLLEALRSHGLEPEASEEWEYDDLFFLLFLNRVEGWLRRAGRVFVYDYPPELAAFSRVEQGRARRFELYWNGLELANGYYELRTAPEYQERFTLENEKRQRLGKEVAAIDAEFLQALEENGGLPEVSGVAIGLDRLFAVLNGYGALKDSSPF